MGKGRTELQYICMMSGRTKDEQLKAAFLRKPYQYTKAETKDDTQTKLHEYDYRKTPYKWG